MFVMKPGIWTALLLLLGCSGCSWVGYAFHNLASTPVDYLEECSFRYQLRREARREWAEIAKSEPKKSYSRAYVDGFEEGFVDWIANGGTGEPPAAPPPCLVRAGLRTPDAPQEIEDWFAGFRHGVHVARQSGWREGVLVPISLPPRPVPGESTPQGAAPEGLGMPALRTGAHTSPPEQLPQRDAAPPSAPPQIVLGAPVLEP
jgi:hypothetical protein